MNKILFFISVLTLSFSGFTQELNCKVSVITDARQEFTTVEKEIFEQLQQTVYDMVNTTQWTKDRFAIEERINCNMVLQIKDSPSPGVYSGSMQIQSTRPAFNSSYNTTIFNFEDDDITFAYSRGAQLIYAPNQFRDNLTSIIAFYAYYIIAMDYDTFSLKGGTQYFNEAQNVVVNAQSSGAKGWKTNETGKRNRYWLVDNALHQLFEPLRICNYEYHRLGVDVMYESLETARKNMYTALNKLNKVVATRPNSVNLLNFCQAKNIELKNLFADAEVKDKQDLVALMQRLDPANSSLYDEISK
jgi:hypothetical protein|tara:strand:- start:11029 stop:11934 length:906 start_codon:yes stop_codon:yes gene_type:complete